VDRGSDDVQHLTPETVEQYFRAKGVSRFPLSSRVDALLDIDPIRQRVVLHIPAVGELPDVSAFERIAVNRGPLSGHRGEWFLLDIDANGMRYEAYALAESVVDQLQHGATFRHAMSESLESLKDLLTKRKKLADEAEAGLIGELLVLKHVVQNFGEDSAIAAWLGPDAGEHDFGFEMFEAEIKTTRSEARVHVIGSETQLQPSPQRPLYLISIQITQAGKANQAFTLPSLVREARGLLDRNSRAFDDKLESLGWREDARDLYTSRFQFRSVPRAFRVDEEFPAITRPRIDGSVPQSVRVSGVTYRLDVTDLPYVGAPEPLSDFCEGHA